MSHMQNLTKQDPRDSRPIETNNFKRLGRINMSFEELKD